MSAVTVPFTVRIIPISKHQWQINPGQTPSVLARLGRNEDALQLTTENKQVCLKHFGENNIYEPKCQLVLSSLSIERSGFPSSPANLWTQARDWALARDAKEVLCWSYLVEAQHALARAVGPVPTGRSTSTETRPVGTGPTLEPTHAALEFGLKIARDCGFGLYHIDLLLERARLHLLRGNAGAALADIEVALGDSSGGGGIPANEETGQVELLAANHEACGYAWPIPAGLQLRAEALLLQAAQMLGSAEWVAGVERSEPPDLGDEASAGGSLRSTRATRSEVNKLVTDARCDLKAAMSLWQPLHDPEPERDDQNFKLDGTEYNYKAADTYRILTDLNQRVLTRLPLRSPSATEESALASVSEPVQGGEQESETTTMVDDAFISYRRVDLDRKFARDLKSDLEAAGYKVAIDERDFVANQTIPDEMERCTRQSRFTVAVISNAYFQSGNTEEEAIIRKVRDMAEKKRGLIPLTIEQVDGELPVWMYDVVGVDFTDSDPLMPPLEKLKQALGNPL